jgi:hypothetical protein
MLYSASAQDISVSEQTFGCILDWPKVRNTRFKHSDPEKLKEAMRIFRDSVPDREYPVGTILQLVPFEAMVKHPREKFPKTNGWEFFALGQVFVPLRCALKIWSGRDGPPPTIQRAGQIPNGPDFDLAPGLVAVSRAARIPDLSSVQGNTAVQISARDLADAGRVLDILRKQGFQIHVQAIHSVHTKPPQVKLSMHFDGPKTWRAAAKCAAIGMCILYGNATARRIIHSDLLEAILSGNPSISEFAGWDYTNPWPTIIEVSPHPKTPNAKPSSFDHSLIVAEVGEDCIGYLEFFGGYRFSIRLGAKTGLPLKGLSVNPLPGAHSRLQITAVAPDSYRRKSVASGIVYFVSILIGKPDIMVVAYRLSGTKSSTIRRNEDVFKASRSEIAEQASLCSLI